MSQLLSRLISLRFVPQQIKKRYQVPTDSGKTLAGRRRMSSNNSIHTEHVDVKLKDGAVCDSFLAYPRGKTQLPTVFLFMDAFGPRAYLYEMAGSIAAQGYFVMLPNLFFRVKRAPLTDLVFPVKPKDLVDARMKFMPLFAKFSPSQTVSDFQEFIGFLKEKKKIEANVEKVGVTGYCFGGGMGIRVAGKYPELVACAAAFHGGNLASMDKSSPHLSIPTVKGELYFGNADKDESLPAQQVNRLKETLDVAKIRYEMELYKDALHGYTMKDLPVYNEEALKRHDEKLFALLDRNLKTPRAKL